MWLVFGCPQAPGTVGTLPSCVSGGAVGGEVLLWVKSEDGLARSSAPHVCWAPETPLKAHRPGGSATSAALE